MYMQKKNKTKIMTFGFDQGASRDVGILFLTELSKTLANGTCPGHHNAVVIINEERDESNKP